MMQRTEVVSRVRLTYAVDSPLSYVSVLDMGRLWERMLRRADLPLAYTQGYHPHPRIYFAAPLPVGYSSECELLDVMLAQPIPPIDLLRALLRQAPQGLTVVSAEGVPVKTSSPQSTMETAHYVVDIESPASREGVRDALAALLGRETIILKRYRRGRMVDYDMRRLIRDLTHVSERAGCHRVEMVLKCGSQGSGRPERIVAELNIPTGNVSIHRTRLIWGGAKENAS